MGIWFFYYIFHSSDQTQSRYFNLCYMLTSPMRILNLVRFRRNKKMTKPSDDSSKSWNSPAEYMQGSEKTFTRKKVYWNTMPYLYSMAVNVSNLHAAKQIPDAPEKRLYRRMLTKQLSGGVRKNGTYILNKNQLYWLNVLGKVLKIELWQDVLKECEALEPANKLPKHRYEYQSTDKEGG